MARGWFESIFPDGVSTAQYITALILVVLLLAIVAWFLGRRSGHRVSKGPARGRQPRLSVMEAAVVDNTRRLVLVRRDQIEHLVLIGGPTDIVVETNIIRGRPAGQNQPGRRPKAGQRPASQAASQSPAGRHAPQPAAPPASAPPSSTPLPAATGQSASDRHLMAAGAAATAAAVLAQPADENSAESTRGETMTDFNPPRRYANGHADMAGQGDSRKDPPALSGSGGEHFGNSDEDLTDVTDETTQSLHGIAEGDLPASSASPVVAGLASGAAALAVAASARARSEPLAYDPGSSTDQGADDAIAADSEPAMEAQSYPALKDPPTDSWASEAADADTQADGASRASANGAAATATDPFGDLESEFKKAFESSLQNLKAEVHAESAAAESADEVVEQAIEPAEIPQPDPATETFGQIGDVEDSAPADDFDDELEAEIEAEAPSRPEAAFNEEMAADEPQNDGVSDASPGESEADTGGYDGITEAETAAEPVLPPIETMMPGPEADVPSAPYETGSVDSQTTAAEVHEGGNHDVEEHAVEPELASGFGLAEPEAAGDSHDSGTEPETADTGSGSFEPDEVDNAVAERSPGELPSELAFLETQAVSDPESADNGNADTETADMAALDTETSESELTSASDDYASAHVQTDDGPEDELQAEYADHPVASSDVTAEEVADEAPEPEAPVNPFPTIPDSVRQSVMAAARRSVPPELAASLADGAGKDVAATTLGDLAQRLEQALSEQAVQTGKDFGGAVEEPDAGDDANDDGTMMEEPSFEVEPDAETHSEDEDTDGAVIDFAARRRDEPEDELEDEMAKLLNDLTGDTNRAG